MSMIHRFPIREVGMNMESQPLQPHEIESMRADTEIMRRVIRSYELMLDFYGMRLLSPETGLLDRVLSPRDFEARYRNLVSECNLMLRARWMKTCRARQPPLITIFVSHGSSSVFRSWVLNISMRDSYCMCSMNRANSIT